MYNNALLKYPVTDGSIWKGKHTILYCNDFLEIGLPLVDYIYTDPPWNDAILRKFWKYSGKEASYKFIDFTYGMVERFATLCPSGEIYIEMGAPAVDVLIKIISRQGGYISWGEECEYGKIPFFILAYTMDCTKVIPPVVINLDEPQASIINTFKHGTLLDACCGECYFLEIGLARGMNVIGTEIIPAKLASGIRRLSKWETIEERKKTHS